MKIEGLLTQELRCSRYVLFLSFFMVPFPVTYLIIAILLFDLDSKGVLSIALSPLFYLAALFWIMSGVGLQKLKKWSWYTFIVAQLLLAYLNALNLVLYSNSAFKGWAFSLTVLIQIYVFVVVSGEIRVPYFFPRIHWWESGIAGMPHLDVELNHLSSALGSSAGQILDMNSRGCFIKTPHDFNAFEKITINLHSFNQKVVVSALVVWNAKSTVTHPKGIGVRFGDMDRLQRRKIRVISQYFQRERNPKVGKKSLA